MVLNELTPAWTQIVKYCDPVVRDQPVYYMTAYKSGAACNKNGFVCQFHKIIYACDEFD